MKAFTFFLVVFSVAIVVDVPIIVCLSVTANLGDSCESFEGV